jgi:hypothetical protein
MKIIVQAQELQSQLHRNLADFYRVLLAELEEGDPAYQPMLEESGLWLSPLEPSLRGAATWQIKHFALPLQPLDPAQPILLFDICLDARYAPTPEIWIGLFFDLLPKRREAFPFTDTLSYLFQDYFGPEDDWKEPKRWYEEKLDDEEVSTSLSFCRIPLDELHDIHSLRSLVCDPIRHAIAQRIEAEDTR